MKINGAQALIKALEKQNVTTIFGYPGGATLPIHDALLQSEQIVHRLVRNEQASVHAASGYSRTGDTIGVCLSTSGPGATNLVTGIATAFMDSIPLIAITGQVPSNFVGTDAFQEVDITGITLPIVKHSYLVKDANDIPQIVEDAFHIASTGRKGPVLIDIPRSVQQQLIEYVDSKKTDIIGYKPNYTPNKKQVKRVYEDLKNAKKPVFLVGGGMVHGHASEEIRNLLDIVSVPTITTLMALGIVDSTDPNFYGMIGLHGNPSANYATMNCDLLISLGARFDDRTTIVSENFAPNAKVVHVDIDPAEIGKNIPVDTPVVADVKIFLNELLELIKENHKMDFTSWIDELNQIRETIPLYYKKDGKLKPQEVLARLSELAPEDAIISTEVGQHQMWTAQFYKFKNPEKFITSGGLGTMGYGLPAAVGAAVANPETMVINIAGDGSFQMNLTEIATALEQNLKIKIILFNNSSLSLVRQLQYFANDKRYNAIEFTSNPDFVKLVQAYPGTEAYRIEKPEEIDEILEKTLSNDKLTLVECIVSNEERVYPVASAAEGIGVITCHGDKVIRLIK